MTTLSFDEGLCSFFFVDGNNSRQYVNPLWEEHNERWYILGDGAIPVWIASHQQETAELINVLNQLS